MIKKLPDYNTLHCFVCTVNNNYKKKPPVTMRKEFRTFAIQSVGKSWHINLNNSLALFVFSEFSQIRRYKASSAIMEKANEVYNKLKLQFVGKCEPAAKTQLENQNQDNGGTEPQLQGIFIWISGWHAL